MCARSEYFAAMLRGQFAEGLAGELAEVRIEEVTPAVLTTALQWVYTDTIDIRPGTAPDIILQVYWHHQI